MNVTTDQSEYETSEYEKEKEIYKFTTPVNRRLSEILEIPPFYTEDFDNTHWEPPNKHGLHNSNFIIPSYYQKPSSKNKILQMDYYEMIKDDIRNYRDLNKHQMEYIFNLEDKYKNEILELFNHCIKMVSVIIS